MMRMSGIILLLYFIIFIYFFLHEGLLACHIYLFPTAVQSWRGSKKKIIKYKFWKFEIQLWMFIFSSTHIYYLYTYICTYLYLNTLSSQLWHIINTQYILYMNLGIAIELVLFPFGFEFFFHYCVHLKFKISWKLYIYFPLVLRNHHQAWVYIIHTIHKHK